MFSLKITLRLSLLPFFLLFLIPYSSSQNFRISEPELQFDGTQLHITYDLTAEKKSDLFYIRVEIEDKEGSLINASSLSGDVGEKVPPGNSRIIVWIPANDSILLDEEISVELFGERYERPFNKGSALLTSSVLPGLGLSKIKEGKKWWLASIPAYGALAGGLAYHFSYLNVYEDYKSETSVPVRDDLLSKAQRQSNISTTCFIAAAAIWTADLIWVAASPNKYKPLQHSGLTLKAIPSHEGTLGLLSFRIEF
jgi:hypothetical protein